MHTGTRTWPEEHVVYWASKFTGNNAHKSYTTPMYKANMMTFEDSRDATAFVEKLTKLANEGGTYRGRLVCHVSACF